MSHDFLQHAPEARPSPFMAGSGDARTPRPPRTLAGEVACLQALIEDARLTTAFQPILGLAARNFLGYEALARPFDNAFFSNPSELFVAAERHGMTNALDRICRETALLNFARSGMPGTLFLNATPSSLADPAFQNGETLSMLHALGLTPSRIVIEITENQKITDFATLRDLLAHYRSMGYRIAIDDLGQGMSNLRMWTEIHPDFVKIDRHFIHGIASNALKFQLVKAMHEMAQTCGASLIAEGIEQQEDFLAVRDLGIPFAQGYFIARPATTAIASPSPEVLDALGAARISVFPGVRPAPAVTATARMLVQRVEPVGPAVTNAEVFARFEAQPRLEMLPVTDHGLPIGLINRHQFIDRFARPYRRELYGRKSCVHTMESAPLLVDADIPIQELSRLIARASRHSLHDGFIITENGQYLGTGSSHEMVALITEMQIRAARYANPLTQLPGNVPINEHIERLLASNAGFVACYADLDAFKPFNDVYGYRRGDDLIQLLAHILAEACDPVADFLGHIGGDDFLMLFQSEDWQARCERALSCFAERSIPLCDEADRERGGICTEDRQGRTVCHPLPTLSIGAVLVQPGCFDSHHDIAGAAAEAKRQAKRACGNSLFVERRQRRSAGTHSTQEELFKLPQ